MRSKMSDQLGALVGRRVGLRLYDGSRLDDCRLISLPGGRLVNTARLVLGGADVFLPVDTIDDVWEHPVERAAS